MRLAHEDHVIVDESFFRPTESRTLVEVAAKVREFLGWGPTHNFAGPVREMVPEDVADWEDCRD